ncbi:Magnesium transporter ALR2 [Spathaspora sp. JA1]|nr:Magnesium transporter ALR2 [Spathaspora sp. JA1]
MSDSESTRSTSHHEHPHHHHDAVHHRTDEGLNDHRNHLPLEQVDDTRVRRASSSTTPADRIQHSGNFMSSLRREFYLQEEDGDDSLVESPITPIIEPMLTRHDTKKNSLSPKMTKFKTNESEYSTYKRDRRQSGGAGSINSEADSHASRSSQETEEDVCFPMSREHIRINGIDFDELEEFINEERQHQEDIKRQQRINIQTTITRLSERKSSITSKSAMKYTPKNILKKTQTNLAKIRTHLEGNRQEHTIPKLFVSSESSESHELDSLEEKHDDHSDQVKFGGATITEGGISPHDFGSDLPDRFSFFHSESDETIHAPDLPSLVDPNTSIADLFKNGKGTWWLDVTCPTDAEMRTFAKSFGIHPLTAEDIRMQEAREKVELFRSYYFVCFHTFENDMESEDYLEPINVYIVVFREGILSFHFSPISHPANVRRRVRQLRDYVEVSADWLCYALIDDITDGFAPVITGIEYEADSIEDSVFVARQTDFKTMLQRIMEARRKVMTLMRLLSGKADVIKMFAKRCQDEAIQQDMSHPVQATAARPRANIALYLGDIQDHVVTMFQNLLAYEKIFSRSHANYLAQLQVESFNSNTKISEMFSKVTLIGTMLVPLNLITGLFGMNVEVPGRDVNNLAWFFGIVGVIIVSIAGSFYFAQWWLKKLGVGEEEDMPVVSSRRSIRSLGLRRGRDRAKSILSFPNKYE